MSLTKSKDRFYARLMQLTYPIVFQKLMLASVAVADALMLGSVQQDAMAAVSLATQIQFVQNMIVFAVISAAAILGAQYWGKGDRKTVEKVLCTSLRMTGGISVICLIGCMFFPRYLMLLFTNEEVLIEIGIRYLKIAGWSYLLSGISQCYLNIMKVSEHAKQTAIVSSAAVILNIVFNAILIHGLLGAPKMGVQGAALATLIARIAEFLLVVVLSFRSGYIRPHMSRIFRIYPELERDYIRCTIPLAGAAMFWGVGFTSFTAFVGHMGVDAAAANSIAAVVRDVVCSACDGVANAAGIMVGNELGAGNLDRARKYGDRLMKLAFIIGFASSAVMLALTPLVIRIVKLTPEARDLLMKIMVIVSVYMIGRVVNTISINGIFAAGGDTLFDLYSLAVMMWGVAVPLAAAGTFWLHWPVPVVYACTCLDEVGKIPWMMFHYKKYKWVKNLTKEF